VKNAVYQDHQDMLAACRRSELIASNTVSVH
jgi:hypothetical protein